MLLSDENLAVRLVAELTDLYPGCTGERRNEIGRFAADEETALLALA